MATGLTSIKSTTKSEKAGLKFPVSRVKSMLMPQDQISYRVSDSAAVYMTAVLEYLTAEILELSLNAAHSGRRKRIQLIDMNVALKGYKDFARQKAVVPKSKFMAAGVLVNIDKTKRQSNASLIDGRQSIASGSQMSVGRIADGNNLPGKRKAQSSNSVDKKTAEKITVAEKSAKKISDYGKSNKTNHLPNASINDYFQSIASGSQMSVGDTADGNNLLGKRKAQSLTSIGKEADEKKTIAEKSAKKISDDGESDKNQA